MIKKIHTAIDPFRKFSHDWLSPLLDLTIRLFMAHIFFISGLLKFKNFLNGHWESTVYLFQDIHPLPGVPAGIAAVMGTSGELLLSILLAIGLFGRFAAAGLLVMTCVIQFAVPEEYGVMSTENYYWMLLLAVIFLKGAGKFALDALLVRFISP